jgi:type II secretion system protein D
VVFRLKNSPAQDVAQAINTFLKTERQVQLTAPGLTSPFEQLEREVVVVPEPVSNSLILSATPRFFEEIRGLIDQLDARPPMVMIQVLIAAVTLGDTNEFGIELGLQDSVLFDRSLLSSAGDLVPGFNFNNQPHGNSGSDLSRKTASSVGGQGLSSFSLGRANGTLGFGGLVLSAASENISVLLRALNECHRVDVLQRPQVMTLDNQPAFIQVGQRVPQITGTQVNQSGQSNAINLINVGLILSVTPRISPDGLVVMEINAEKSELGPEAEGIPVAFSEGQVIRSPRIDTATAQTTVSATSGQTVILGGLISKNTNQLHRKVPWLGDVPLLGHLFRYDSVSTTRQELLIIMTPHIVRNDADAESIKRAEAARMNWCMSDVISINGDTGLRRRIDEWSDSEVPTVYPDRVPPPRPDQPDGPEIVPMPAGAPLAPATSPLPPAKEPLRAVPPSGAEGWLRRPQSGKSE